MADCDENRHGRIYPRANGFHGLKAAGVSVPVINYRKQDPTVRKAALDSGLRRVPDKCRRRWDWLRKPRQGVDRSVAFAS